MSDPTVRDLAAAVANYARRAAPAETDAAHHEARRRLLDALGVALGALDQPGPRAARRYAGHWATVAGPLIWGTAMHTSPEAATLVNGNAVRYLDFNDAYFHGSGLHPSDVIAGLVAVGETADATLGELIAAISVAYEVGINLTDAFEFRRHGWDHATVIALATCAGAGRLLGLSAEELAHALAITTLSHGVSAAVRTEHVSMWKSFAAPDAARHAVGACLLAHAGVTAPDRPFERRNGVNQLRNGGFDPEPAPLSALDRLDAPSRILDAHIKAWPVGHLAQSAVHAACALHREINHDDIAEVTITTYQAAVDRMGSPEKWEPRTRETADHSLPYVTLVALQDGDIGPQAFIEKRFASREVHAFLRDHVVVKVDAAYTAAYPTTFPTRVDVVTATGAHHSHFVERPIGHARNPLSDDRLRAKFLDLAEPVLRNHAGDLYVALHGDPDAKLSTVIGLLTPAD